MKKGLLFATALCMATSAMAQTSIETALDAQTGKNTYNVDGETSQTIYWKFTADKDYLAKVSPKAGSSDEIKVFISNGEEESVLTGASLKYPNKAYSLKKGETYYFKMTNKGELTFYLELTETSSYGKGLSENDPIELKLDEDQYFGDPTSTSSYEQHTIYATYTAKQSGKLKMNFYGYVNGAEVNGTTYPSEYDSATGGYTLGFAVEEGQTYSIKLNLNSGMVAKSEVAKVVFGSLDTPFTLTDGDNTAPAAQGEYYYTYTPSKVGYFSIKSDAVLAGGQVKVYASKYDIVQGNVVATSEPGSYNVRIPVNYTGSTYYIVVNKLQTTDADDKLSVSMEEFKAGETINNPIEITELPFEQTLPEAKGTYYYSINIPANTNKFVVIKADKAELNESTSAIFYNKSAGEYGAATMQNGMIKQYFGDSYDQTYIIKVTSNEEEPLKFSVAYEEAAKGSLASSPMEAVAGDNEITIDGTEYFTYTATKTGKLSIEGEPGVKISFPRGTNSWSGYYDSVQKGVEYYISAQAGTTYLIQVDNAQKGTTFYLEESEFKAGESSESPIVMEGDEYTFTSAGASDLWLLYNATSDGILDFRCTAIYSNETNGIIFVGKDPERVSAMMGTETNGTETTTVYKGRITVAKGDKLYIHCKLPGTVTGDKIIFTQHEAQPGETLQNPLVLEKGGSVMVTGVSYETPVWVKVDLPAGTTDLRLTGTGNGYVFPNLEEATNGGNRTEFNFYQEYGPNYTPILDENGNEVYKASIYMQEAGTAYLYFQRGGGKLSYTDGTATGINSVELFNDGKAEIFKADGTKVSEITGSGLYIIKAGGKTKKVMIKK